MLIKVEQEVDEEEDEEVDEEVDEEADEELDEVDPSLGRVENCKSSQTQMSQCFFNGF